MGAQSSERLRESLPAGWLPLGHAETIRSLPELDLVAVCDSDDEKVKTARELHGGPAGFTDYREMLEVAQPEIVTIATRTLGRGEIIQNLCEHGVRGIHSEKPLGRSREEFRWVLDTVIGSDVAFSYGTTRRFMAVYRRALDMVANGTIGKVQLVEVEFGRTWLMWNHPHSVDLMLAFAGCREIEYVQANCEFDPQAWDGRTLDFDPTVDFGYVRFGNGVQGMITVASGFNVSVTGEVGSLAVCGNGDRIELRTADNEGDRFLSKVDSFSVDADLSGTQVALTELASAVRACGRSVLDPEDIRISGDILLALAWSGIHAGRRVKTSEVPQDFVVTGRIEELFA